MQIVLFGGSFDPAQKAHRLLPQAILDQHLAEQIWFVPTHNHPFEKRVSPDQHRVAMLELLIKSAFWHHPQLRPDQLKIERYELEHPGPSYSYLTLQALAGQYPEHMFKWLIGSDLVSNFHKWYHAQELLQHFSVLVYPRQNFPAEPLLPGMTLLEGVDPVAISSTQVRKRLAAGLAISDLVDTEVERYIRSNHLYGI